VRDLRKGMESGVARQGSMTEEGPNARNADRRDFLRRLAGAGAIVAGSGVAAVLLRDRETGSDGGRAGEADAAPRLARYAVELPPGAPRMSIARGSDAPAMVRAAMEGMGGVGRFIQKGDVVVVKPNVGFDRSPRLGATTSPEVVGAVVALCREAGAARVIVVDNPINNPEGSFLRSGVGPSVEENGGEVLLPAARHFREIEIGGEALERWEFFYEPFRRATKVIGLPTAKSHNLSVASLAMKNWYGLLGRGRNRFHQAIDTAIADLGSLVTPTLVVLDATRLLVRNGPTGGSPADVKPGHTIAVSADQVALDAFGLELLGKAPADAPWLRQAEERGLGTGDWRSLSPRDVQVG